MYECLTPIVLQLTPIVVKLTPIVLKLNHIPKNEVHGGT